MNEAYKYQVGKCVRTVRVARGLTQEQLSARLQVQGCDITRSALAKVEAGQRHLYPDELRALKLALNCHYEDLLP